MIRPLAIVTSLSVLGDIFAQGLETVVPGPVIGMLVLATWFAMNRGLDRSYAQLFDAVVPHFPMFFIPSAVGILTHIEVIATAWLFIAVAITFGTAMTIVFTGWISQSLLSAYSGTNEI